MQIPDQSGEGGSPFMTVAEVAAYLRLSAMTVRRLIDQGDLPAVRAGKQYRVHREQLARAVQLDESSA